MELEQLLGCILVLQKASFFPANIISVLCLPQSLTSISEPASNNIIILRIILGFVFLVRSLEHFPSEYFAPTVRTECRARTYPPQHTVKVEEMLTILAMVNIVIDLNVLDANGTTHLVAFGVKVGGEWTPIVYSY